MNNETMPYFQDSSARRAPGRPATLRDCGACPMRKHGLFCDLGEANVQALNRQKITNRYARGQVLFYEGNPAKGVFCVRSGKFKVYKNGSDGKETILRIAQAGDVLGYESVLARKDYHATIEVLEEGDVCFVGAEFVHALVGKDATLALTAVRELGAHLSDLEDRFSYLMNQSVRSRFIDLLLKLERRHGRKERDGIFLNVRLTRQELGAMVGATPETVIRLLSEMSREDLVVLDGKKIFLKNVPELAEIRG